MSGQKKGSRVAPTLVHFEITVKISGPLGLSLRQYTPEEREWLPKGVNLVVVGFQPSPDGKHRELQGAGVLPGDVLVTVNDQLPTDPSKMGIWMKSFPRPFTLQFVRVTHTLDGLICACILPAPQHTICIPLLRNLVRRSARSELDPLGSTGYRALAWSVLLGVLSSDPSCWAAEMTKQREMYRWHSDELLKKAKTMAIHEDVDKYDRKQLEEELGGQEDRINTWDAVERDVHRTYIRCPTESMVEHRNQLQRLLTVHALINRGVGYVQGMNEIAGVVLEELVACATVKPQHPRPSIIQWETQREHTEADAFWLFSAIICGPCRDAFIADNDASIKAEEEAAGNVAVDMSAPSAGGGGLVARLSELQRRVRLAAPSVDRLVHKTWALRPHIYATRWYSVLLRREYWAHESQGKDWNSQLWDCMLAFTGGDDDARAGPWDEARADCLLDLCCAYLTLLRPELEACADVNGALSVLLSQRRMISFDETVAIRPPKVPQLIAEASRVRQVRLGTEFRNQVKASVGRAVKGLLSNFSRNSDPDPGAVHPGSAGPGKDV